MLNITQPDEVKRKFYYDKIPLYMKNSYGYVDMFFVLYEIFFPTPLFPDNNLLPNEDLYPSTSSAYNVLLQILNAVNMYDVGCDETHETSQEAFEHYLEFINSLEGSENGTKSDILDKFALLFGINRRPIVTVNGTSEQLTLNNRELIFLIKSKLSQVRYTGTYLDMKRYFENLGLIVQIVTANGSIESGTETTGKPATCYLTLYNVPDSIYSISENVKKMFLGGLLNCPSMGILYEYTYLDLTNLLILDSTDSNNTLDQGVLV